MPLSVTCIRHSNHRIGIIIPIKLKLLNYQPRKFGLLGYVEHEYITCSELLHDFIQKLELELNPGRLAQDPTTVDTNEPTMLHVRHEKHIQIHVCTSDWRLEPRPFASAANGFTTEPFSPLVCKTLPPCGQKCI